MTGNVPDDDFSALAFGNAMSLAGEIDVAGATFEADWAFVRWLSAAALRDFVLVDDASPNMMPIEVINKMANTIRTGLFIFVDIFFCVFVLPIKISSDIRVSFKINGHIFITSLF